MHVAGRTAGDISGSMDRACERRCRKGSAVRKSGSTILQGEGANQEQLISSHACCGLAE